MRYLWITQGVLAFSWRTEGKEALWLRDRVSDAADKRRICFVEIGGKGVLRQGGSSEPSANLLALAFRSLSTSVQARPEPISGHRFRNQEYRTLGIVMLKDEDR